MSRRHCQSCCLAALVWAALAGAAPARSLLYVDADASAGANDGSSWADAFTSLQAALDAASETGGQVEIRVAEGVYQPTEGPDRSASFYLIEEVAINGGFAGSGQPDPDHRDVAAFSTVLSGDIGTPGDPYDNTFHVVTAVNVFQTAVLDGCTITAGRADGAAVDSVGAGAYCLNAAPMFSFCTFIASFAQDQGGGMYVNGDGPTISYCTFRGNTAATGGGLFSLHASPVMTGCTFSSNTADQGGAVANLHGGPRLSDCLLTANSATFRGGGMYNFWYGGGATLTNCVLCGNSAASGGALYNDGLFVEPILTGCLFSGNLAAVDGGALYNDTSVSSLLNCTFASNRATGGHGGGIYNPSQENIPTLLNGILWGNWDADGPVESAQLHGGTPTIDYSCVQGHSGALGGLGTSVPTPN